MTCFDRTRETADLWQQFDQGCNLLMLAPHRIGKTVLLNRLRDMAAEPAKAAKRSTRSARSRSSHHLPPTRNLRGHRPPGFPCVWRTYKDLIPGHRGCRQP